MEDSWVFTELSALKDRIERIIQHAVEQARENQRWDCVADDLIDAKVKLESAIKVRRQ